MARGGGDGARAVAPCVGLREADRGGIARRVAKVYTILPASDGRSCPYLTVKFNAQSLKSQLLGSTKPDLLLAG